MGAVEPASMEWAGWIRASSAITNTKTAGQVDTLNFSSQEQARHRFI